MVKDKNVELALIPGLNNTGEVWAGVESYLPPHINLYMPTLPAINNVEELAKEVLAILPEKFYLCGFSFGGYVALAMLSQAPERILGFSLLGSLPNADTEEQKKVRQSVIEKAQAGRYETLVESQAHLIFHEDNLQNEEIQRQRRKIVSDYGLERFIAHQQACKNRADRTELLRDLSVPFLMMTGDNDVVFPVEKQKRLAQQIPGTRFVEITNSGHMAPLENPQQIAEELVKWLK